MTAEQRRICEDACAQLEELGEKARNLLERLPADSPLRGPAARTVAMAAHAQSQLQARLRVEAQAEGDVDGDASRVVLGQGSL